MNATHLVGWIEFDRLLGVEKVFFYDTTVIGWVWDVLRHRTPNPKSVAEFTPFTFDLSMVVWIRNHPLLIYMCVYLNINLYA